MIRSLSSYRTVGLLVASLSLVAGVSCVQVDKKELSDYFSLNQALIYPETSAETFSVALQAKFRFIAIQCGRFREDNARWPGGIDELKNYTDHALSRYYSSVFMKIGAGDVLVVGWSIEEKNDIVVFSMTPELEVRFSIKNAIEEVAEKKAALKRGDAAGASLGEGLRSGINSIP